MTYLGAKSGAGVFQTIIALMPPHDTYIEPFAGSAEIAKRKVPAGWNLLYERDQSQYAELCRYSWPSSPDVQFSLHCGDTLAMLEEADPFGPNSIFSQGRTLVYADPPYLLSTRTGRDRYAHEFTDQDHFRLAESLQRLAAGGVAVIVSGYPSALYDQLYAGWNTREMQAMTRGGARTEKLWFNFVPDAVHWSTFAGHNKDHRQRIKRKAARWAARWAKLPAAVRQAILAAMLAAGDR